MSEELPTVAHVAMPLALAHPLIYEVPAALRDELRIGHRVRVPLRGKQAHGFVVALARESPDAKMKLRPISALDPPEAVLEPPLLQLLRWLSHYYVAPLGMAIEAAVPRSIARPPREKATELAGEAAQREPPDAGAEAALQAEADAGAHATDAPPPLVLNPHQQAALERIGQALDASQPQTLLLQGVTGSGKTEVYLRAAELAVARGSGVLFLVPEIALGTQIVRRVRRRFGPRIAEYHSQMRPAARRRAWWDARRGAVDVVVGARSAVFAPVHDLGLVIVDEEHEPSYKQGETPRYHARDTALVRARLAGAVAVLGSATPSLESRTNAERGKYQRLLLPERIDARPTPRVTLVDLRYRRPEDEEQPISKTGPDARSAASGAARAAIPDVRDRDAPADPASDAQELAIVDGGEKSPEEPLSEHLLGRLRATIADGDQAILFLNRRGFATHVQCRDCGHIFECPRCSVVLTFHRSQRLLRCHYCNHQMRDVEACPQCGSLRFTFGGTGTQKVEASLTQHLPQARVLRMDLDSTRKRGETGRMIAAFEQGEVDVLLGTQMVAKGFDFPRVTLVGVINADREMGLPDFRSQERAFQLLTQVAGRAGRGAKCGEVIFQTYMPDHHVIVAAGRQDYEAFYQREVAERSALGYPPLRRMANLLFDGPDESAVVARAEQAHLRLQRRLGIELLGPAPMPLSRLKNQFRWHLTMLCNRPSLLGEALHAELAREVRPAGRRAVRVQVDVDPASML
ncbi:MAG: primosomal protein N' [Candidatus Eisenbacteria bacterium]|nr:primosomal protein N' [Candidatus Eisenbacteria bacterium]